jgi:hypothetical protein
MEGAVQAVQREMRRRRQMVEQQIAEEEQRLHSYAHLSRAAAAHPQAHSEVEARVPDLAEVSAEVAQAARGAVQEARRVLRGAFSRHLPVYWQRRLALWWINVEVALPSANLVLERAMRWLESRMSVTLPRQLPAIPTPVLFPLFLFCLRFRNMLLKHLFLLGLASVIFNEDCDICCETKSSVFMVSNSCGHRCCRKCLSMYLETNLHERIARMRHARGFTIRCFGGCEERLDRRLAFVGCPELRPFLRLLKRREELISRCPQGTQWVECPGCLVSLDSTR